MDYWSNLPRDNRCGECGTLVPSHREAGRIGKRIPICESCQDRTDQIELDKTHDYFTNDDLRSEGSSKDSDLMAETKFTW